MLLLTSVPPSTSPCPSWNSLSAILEQGNFPHSYLSDLIREGEAIWASLLPKIRMLGESPPHPYGRDSFHYGNTHVIQGGSASFPLCILTKGRRITKPPWWTAFSLQVPWCHSRDISLTLSGEAHRTSYFHLWALVASTQAWEMT